MEEPKTKKPPSFGRILIGSLIGGLIAKFILVPLWFNLHKPAYSTFSNTSIGKEISKVDSLTALREQYDVLARIEIIDTSYYNTEWAKSLVDQISIIGVERKNYLKDFYKVYARLSLNSSKDAMECIFSFYHGNKDSVCQWSNKTQVLYDSLLYKFGYLDVEKTRLFYDSTIKSESKKIALVGIRNITRRQEIQAGNKYLSGIRSTIRRNYKFIFNEDYGKD